jgi:hypothetical protein
MEQEIITMLKTVIGSTETLVIWYMILAFSKHVISCVAVICCFYYFGRGLRAFFTVVETENKELNWTSK